MQSGQKHLLRADPDELQNRYEHPELAVVRRELMERLYDVLRERGDNFYHWMTSMYDVGEVDYDPTQSGLDETTYQGGEPIAGPEAVVEPVVVRKTA